MKTKPKYKHKAWFNIPNGERIKLNLESARPLNDAARVQRANEERIAESIHNLSCGEAISVNGLLVEKKWTPHYGSLYKVDGRSWEKMSPKFWQKFGLVC